MPESFTFFEAADHVRTAADSAALLSAALEDEPSEPGTVAVALNILARAGALRPTDRELGFIPTRRS